MVTLLLMATLPLRGIHPLCWLVDCPLDSKCVPSSKVFLLLWRHQESYFTSLQAGVSPLTGVSPLEPLVLGPSVWQCVCAG